MSAGQANQPSSRAEWWMIFILGLASLALGAYGIHLHDLQEGEELTLPSELYHALQLFALHGYHYKDAHAPLPWELHAGRIGAAFVVFWTAVKIGSGVLATYAYLLRMVWRPGHVVVCGLGQLGLSMALQARRAGWRVVAIERNDTGEGARSLRAAGVPVIAGNACDEAVLRRARVGRARRIWALTDDDDINIGVAALAGTIARSPFSEGMICRPFIAEPRLRDSLRLLPAYAKSVKDYRVETGPDLFTLRARRAFAQRARALDHCAVPPGKAATLVVVGFGRMGEALAIQAARIGHFESTEKLRIVMVDENADACAERLRNRYRYLETLVCTLEKVKGSADAVWVRDRLVKECEEAHATEQPITVAFCHDGQNEENVRLALDFARAVPEPLPGRQQFVSLLVHLDTNCGISRLLPEDGSRARDVDPRLHVFGALEEVWTLDLLENERDDELAKQFHQAWLAECEEARKKAEKEQKPYSPKPAEVPWEELREFYRESNRAIADHVPVKMRALGYEVAKIAERGTEERITALSESQIGLLAEMEHRRWCAHHWLDGWQYAAERNDVRKLHPSLLPWKDLPDQVRTIDEKMMSTIVTALEAVGEGVYQAGASRDESAPGSPPSS